MHNKTLAELIRIRQQGEVSCVELTRYFLQRIQQFNPSLNAFISIAEEPSLAAAQHADTQQNLPLCGIPIAHKDIFCTAGLKTSCGSKMLDNFIAPYDATVVAKLKTAGAITLGKTNMDEFAMGSSSENSYYDAVKNPWDVQCVAGGSSGGSAAAVAAGLIPAATGTDTGGSIRQPAALCGVTGLKPTYGRVSRYGMVAYASSLDQGGVFAKSAEDIALVLQHMAGFDAHDSTSVNHPVARYSDFNANLIAGCKIGLPKQYFNAQLDPAIAQLCHNVAQQLEQQGAVLSDIDLPHLDYAIPAYYVIACAEASSNLARYDGVRYGYRCEHPRDLMDLYQRSRQQGFGMEVKRRIMMGTYVLSAGYYDAYYHKATQLRYLIRQDFINAFKDVDMILAPVTPTSAFKLGQKTQDPVSMYLADIYTIAINLAGLPAIAFPAGFINQLPIGVQLIGNYFAEQSLLNITHYYQQLTDWHRHMPPQFKE